MQATDLYATGPYLATLRDLNVTVPKDQRDHLVNQLIVAFRDYYVHLPIKMAAFAVDPVEELRLLLADEAANYEQLSFLKQLLRIINQLRDRHTTLTLPEPWKRMVAYLPIMVERYYANGKPVYVISKKLFGYVNDAIVPGTHITHWNGMPIGLYLRDVLAMASQGANIYAAGDLALANLTIRPLAYALLPDEDWATLSCITAENAYQTITLPWKYFVEPGGLPPTSHAKSGSASPPETGLDERMHHINSYNGQLFGGQVQAQGGAQGTPLAQMGNTLKYGVINTASGDAGYIRIFSFEVGDTPTFITQITDILQGLPQNRLIIDLRNNPGGIIPAGESLVQLLSPKPIETSPVSFRNTPATKSLGALAYFKPWEKSLGIMDVTGEVFSQSFSLTDLSGLPSYRFPGKVALIIDALSYSTCDFFAADFKDNGVGPIVGTEARTGAGGANVWTYSNLEQYTAIAGGNSLGPLLNGMGLNIAMRRSLRTGPDVGLPVEDLGTQADFVHHLTYNDLMNNNVDLLNFTVQKIL